MHVTVRKGRDGKPDVNGAMRVLKKKLMRDGFFQELRARESFMSKGEKERKAKAAEVLVILPVRPEVSVTSHPEPLATLLTTP